MPMIVARFVRSRFTLLLAGCASLLLAQGCSSGSAKAKKTTNLPSTGVSGETAHGTVGWIVRVNEDAGYAVVEGQHLPSAGSQGKIFREEVFVGTIRFDRHREANFGIADILNGFVQKGDRVVY